MTSLLCIICLFFCTYKDLKTDEKKNQNKLHIQKGEKKVIKMHLSIFLGEVSTCITHVQWCGSGLIVSGSTKFYESKSSSGFGSSPDSGQ